MDRIATRELALGLWKIHILHHAVADGVVGHHMLQELRRHGHEVSPGTLYPLLHRMERNGWLRVTSGSEGGAHGAHTYTATPEGADVLAEVCGYVTELYHELKPCAPTRAEKKHRPKRGGRRTE